ISMPMPFSLSSQTGWQNCPDRACADGPGSDFLNLVMARRYGLSYIADVATASGRITVSKNTGFEKCRPPA
ncbi:MAG: hypothetical protein ACPHE2_03680, partial [Candidatus Puniceispirillaceae bacterium]